MWSPTQRLQFETRYFPFIVVTVYEGWNTPDVVFMLKQYEVLFQRNLRYALIVDTTRTSTSPNPMQRKLVTDWDVQNTANTERCNVGTAIVFSSALIRGTLTAMSWLVQRKVPIAYVATIQEASVWSQQRLKDAGVALTTEAKGYLFTRGVELMEEA
jgi:hypothetical protein